MILYTAIMGRPDVLNEPIVEIPDAEALCYTDLAPSTIRHNRGRTAYDFRWAKPPYDEPRVRQRNVKIFWPPVLLRDGFSMYMDSTICLTAPPETFLDLLGDADMLLIPHPLRDCAYVEGAVVSGLKMDDDEWILPQLDRYRAEGFPEHWGLYCGSVILRRHNDRVRAFSKAWFDEVVAGSFRDQLSLPYILWKHKVKFAVAEGVDWTDNELFGLSAHLRESRGREFPRKGS